jgi:hypothetical protein
MLSGQGDDEARERAEPERLDAAAAALTAITCR